MTAYWPFVNGLSFDVMLTFLTRYPELRIAEFGVMSPGPTGARVTLSWRDSTSEITLMFCGSPVHPDGYCGRTVHFYLRGPQTQGLLRAGFQKMGGVFNPKTGRRRSGVVSAINKAGFGHLWSTT